MQNDPQRLAVSRQVEAVTKPVEVDEKDKVDSCGRRSKLASRYVI